MALKIGGTTVINDSRGLENISNLKTVNNESILGVGNISTVRKYSQNVAALNVRDVIISHNFGTIDVLVQVYIVSTGETVECDVARISANTVKLSFSTTQSDTLNVIIIG